MTSDVILLWTVALGTATALLLASATAFVTDRRQLRYRGRHRRVR